MTIYDELKARGLIAQVTDEEEIKDVINNGKATFYIGFDCTADSLTAGHFMALTLMKRLQQAGNRPIALIGGGTTMIGDPSGRTDMRKMLTKEDIDHNAECFKRQMERFIEFGEGKALMLNNADWLLDLNYIELLREVGPCFSVNNMLRAECYKQRMEKGLSFLEFNYMIMPLPAACSAVPPTTRICPARSWTPSLSRTVVSACWPPWSPRVCAAPTVKPASLSSRAASSSTARRSPTRRLL